MAVNWGLAGPGFDASEVLQSFGQAQTRQLATRKILRDERQEARVLAARQQGGAQLQAGDYAGARSTAFQAGDLDFATKIGALETAQTEQLRKEAEGIANLAYSLRTVPAAERAAIGTPILQQMGVDPAHIAQVNWSDNGIRGAYGWASSVKDQIAAQLGEARVADVATDNARADRLATNTVNSTTARLALARNADARGARADARAAQARSEGRVRFQERDKDRAALAGGRYVPSNTDDLDY